MRAMIGLSVLALCCILGIVPAAEGGSHLWTFDEGQADQVADAVGDRPGDVHGARRTNGRRGPGLRFDGVDDYVALPDNDPVWLPAGDFTVSFWVRFERDKGSSVDENEVLVDLNAGSSSDPENELGYIVFRRGDNGRFGFQMATLQNTDEDLDSQMVPVRDRWYHVAAVRQGAMQRIYIDGQMDAWRTCSSSPIDFVGGYDDDAINVGRYTTTIGLPRYHFKGVLDELMLFDRALSAAEIRQLHREALTSNALYVDGAHGHDQNNGLRSLTALATIQKAIDLAKDGDIVNVFPGVYREEVRFLGKAITLQSAADAAIIEAPGGFGVSFYMGEGADTVLRNFVIANSYVGIFCVHSAPTITNVTVTRNVYGAEAYGWPVIPSGGSYRISNSIIWGNGESDLVGFTASYCCVGRSAAYAGSSTFQEYVPDLLVGEPWDAAPRAPPVPPWPYTGSLDSDPLFVDPDNDDYHLRSARGRYWPVHDVWVLDDVSSPCIDAGDPAADFSDEREPNGGRLNIGAHGGTPFAALSE